METKKSTPTKIDFDREWANPKGGTVYYFKIEFANGDKGQFSCSKKEQDKFTLGKEEEYNREERVQGNYTNIIISKPSAKGNPFKPSAKGNESFALAYAKDIMIASWNADKPIDAPKAITSEQMFILADKMFDWLESKKK